MREIDGDLWEIPGDARCITTNGTIKRDARGVMGRGVARQAKNRYLALERTLGGHLQLHGNHTGVLIEAGPTCAMPLIALPVKHVWEHKADLVLVARSVDELVVLTEARGWQTVLLPRPGCGNGGLAWVAVEKVLRKRLDDRFLVVNNENERVRAGVG